MKKISVLLIALALALTLTSCAFVKGMVVKCEVKFDLNGGVAGADFVESVTVKYGQTVAMPTPTMENFSFEGWYDGETLYTSETPIEKDVTLTAKWTFNNTYTLAFDTNGMADVPVSYPVIGELPAIPAAPQVEGYVFAGWYFEPEYTTRFFFDYSLNEATTLYAKFYDLSLGEYTVISNYEQLAAIKDAPDAKYLLACDINCKGELLAPINEFTGELEGNGYRIFNFDINEDSSNVAFIRTNKGTVKNLTFDDFTFDVLMSSADTKYYGVICGINEGTVENCHTTDGVVTVNCSINGANSKVNFGGIVGQNAGIIEGCTNNSTINANFTATGYYIGAISGSRGGSMEPKVAGVCGYVLETGKVIDCANFADITITAKSENQYGYSYIDAAGIISENRGKVESSKNTGNININLIDAGYITFDVGGGVAYNTGSITNSYVKCNININNNSNDVDNILGGFACYNSGKLYNCYSAVNIKDTTAVYKALGGFVGFNELLSGNESLVNKCFAMGSIEIAGTSTNVGAFVGLSTGTVKDAYYADTLTINKVVTTTDENGETVETIEVVTYTNNIGNAKPEGELLALDFLENTLYFDRMVWFLVEGKLPELR